MGEVTTINAGASLPTGEKCDEAIKTLERLLEQAKRGEVVGLAYVAVQPNLAVGFGFDGWERMTLLGGVSMMQAKMVESMD